MKFPASKAGGSIPEKVWAWYLWRHYMMAAVQPNNGHRAVAAWQDFADVHVITQNVDNLHERAGSNQCTTCTATYSSSVAIACGSNGAKLPAMPEPVETIEPPRARAAA